MANKKALDKNYLLTQLKNFFEKKINTQFASKTDFFSGTEESYETEKSSINDGAIVIIK